MNRLALKVKQLRLEQNLTAKQLGKKLGVSESFIIDIEAGRKIINDKVMNGLIKILGRTLEDDMLHDAQSEESGGQADFVKKDINAIRRDAEEKLKENRKKLEIRQEQVASKQTQPIWNSAFESVLKEIPVYDNEMDKVLDTRLLPIISNKVEGYTKDKVLFLQIQNNDMIGFRIVKGDVAFGHITHGIENTGIYLIEYNSNQKRVIRQLKRIDQNNVLLINNDGTLKTDTVSIKDIKILAKLDRIEFSI